MSKKDGSSLPEESSRPASAACVRDYMTTNVTTLNDQSRLLDAALLIRRTGKRHVPIVDEAGKPVGIISDRDVSRMAPSMLSRMTPEEYNQIFEATPITIAMTRNPITASPEMSIREAVSLLYEKKIGAIIVTEAEQVVGILTVTDMLGLLSALLQERSDSASA